MAGVHRRRDGRGVVQQAWWQRAEAQPAKECGRRERCDKRGSPRGGPNQPPPRLRRSAEALRAKAEGSHYNTGFHRVTSIVAVSVRPNTSGSYISSTCAGAVRNVPAVVARTT